jgi:hypothetical protein
MPKRSSRDINETAFSVVQQATQEPNPAPQVAANVLTIIPKPPPPPTTPPGKNPAAVELGRLGGLKGGKARAQRLSKERMKEIGRMGAAAKWKNKRKSAN